MGKYPLRWKLSQLSQLSRFNALLFFQKIIWNLVTWNDVSSFFYKQHALKGQKLLAQGSALGNHGRKFVALKGQKLSSTRQFTKLLPLQGALLIAIIPRAMPWARSFCPFRACGANLRKLRSKCCRYPCTVFYRIMWVNCPIIRVFIVVGERVNTSGYPYAVFYSVM